MTVRRIVRLFSAFSIVPVKVNEIRDQIIEWGFHDSIILSPFSGEISRLRGLLLHYQYDMTYGKKVSYCVIRYNSKMTLDWQRLTCVKELIHSMDVPYLQVNSREKAETLLDHLSLDGSLSEGMTPAAIFEEVATYQALAVLCPDEAIEQFKKEKKDEFQIANILDVPPAYAGVVMQDDWPQKREKFISFSE
jgi:Zn-dependent peptidase ImmA (M78 family)